MKSSFSTQTSRLVVFPLLLLALQGAKAESIGDSATNNFADLLTANVTLTSQYVSRGFRQTWGEPALQGGVDYVNSNGFFVGTWMSNVSHRYIENGSIEWDLYGGYAGNSGPLGYSGTLFYYKYPGAVISATNTKYDYGELGLGLTYKFMYAKYNYTYTKDFFGITDARGTGYLDLGSNIDLGSGYLLNLHYGVGRVASTGGADNSIWNWKDAKIGISKALQGGWTIAGAYTQATGATNVYDRFTTGALNSAGAPEVSNPTAGTLLLSLSKKF
ncbi:MAG: choline dehydrogenase [Polaromonas sp.]|nr:choline dehydrogenase [Polaromonas sp.]